jgi:hypothetical protein
VLGAGVLAACGAAPVVALLFEVADALEELGEVGVGEGREVFVGGAGDSRVGVPQ